MTQTRTIGGVAGAFMTLYAYDAADRVVTLTHPSGEVVTETYNAAGQPTALGGWNGYVIGAVYNALGQPLRVDFGNGLSARYRYFGLNANPAWGASLYGRVRQVCVNQTMAGECADDGLAGDSATALLNLAYWYDSVGNITAQGDRSPSQWNAASFTYDPLDRLTGVTGSYTESYSYNATGNLTSKAGVTYSYTDTAHKHAVTSLSNGATFMYDQNGNMVVRVEGGVTYTQTWDIDNRLVSVTKGSQTTSYFYDADGVLVRKMEPRGQTLYGTADYQVFTPTPVTVTIPSTFTHKLYMPVAFGASTGACPGACTYYRFGGQPVAVRTGGSVYWLHSDHLGSASATTDINGTKVSELRYTPYGQTRYSSGDTPTNKRFTSQEEQAGIGLYSFGARFYVPSIGRFLSADSIVPRPGDPQSLNRYSYVRNNPLRHVDPSGHCLDDVCNNSVVSHVIYNAGYVTLRQSIIREHSLNSDIVSPHFVAQVLAGARQSKLPPQLLAASMYAEMNSRWVKDEFEDAAVAAVGQCGTGCEFGNPMWSLAKVGELFIANDQSFGPAKIKPSSILESATALRRAGVSAPSDATDAALQSLDFDHSVQFAAAYLKRLADLRKGDSYGNSREYDMTTVDMQVVRVAYNEGLWTFWRLGGGSYQFYQTTTNIRPGGVGDEVSPWLGAFAELYAN